MNQPAPSDRVLNVPNVLTTIRLVLSIGVFMLIHYQMFQPAFVVFVIAAATDWIDGYWARKFGQVSKVGRIYDPFVDKIIICGTFIYLAAEKTGVGDRSWLAVVVMGCRRRGAAVVRHLEPALLLTRSMRPTFQP